MISVVIPALNEEKYLPDCLKSLRNQDYTGQYEIIIADNGSVDKTVRLAQDWGARVVMCPEKKSVFYARQIGADAVQGDIIAQADADTVYPRNWLSRIANRFEKHPEVIAVTGRYTYTEPPWWAIVEYTIRNGLNRLTVPLFGRPLIISGATFAFRRETFSAVGGYRGITYAPDQWGIASRLNKLGKVAYDKDLCVVTSPRSVNKPLLRIFKEGIVNWSRWDYHMLKQVISLIRRPINKTFHKKRKTSILLLIIIAMILTGGYFIPALPFFGKIYAAAKSSDKTIALTFDGSHGIPHNVPRSNKSLTVQTAPIIIEQLPEQGEQLDITPAYLHVLACN